MKQRHSWLFALLSILIFVMLPCTGLAAETSGKLEVGGVITDVEDNTARVNEYVKNRTDDGGSPSLKLDVDSVDGQSAFDLGVDINGKDNFNLDTELDFGRVLRLDIELDSLQHWKDHEDLGYIGATQAPDLEGDQPRIFSDKTVPDPNEYPGLNTAGIANRTGAREHYYQELDNDYIVTRREWENDADLTLPQLPNLTFHAGMRIETRDGQEQSITSSKCSYCHVSAQGKDIRERTEDLTAGVTGKFGQLTVEYGYLNRTFDDSSEDVQYNYVNAGTNNPAGDNITANFFPITMRDQLNYWGGPGSFAETPESEKVSHDVKARFDLDQYTNFKASYVNSEVTSNKDANSTYDLSADELKTEFESFGGKVATRFGAFRLSARANTYEIESDDVVIDMNPQSDVYTAGGDESGVIDQTDITEERHWESAEAREVTEFGLDAVYRLMRYTTLRLGYDFEEEDRADEHFGTTETNTFTAAANTRFGQGMSARLSYEFQDIDEPFVAHDAMGIAQNQDELAYTYNENGIVLVSRADAIALNGGSPLLYWDEYGPYGLRTDDGTNRPDEVNEVKGKFSWSVNPQMAATFFMRYRMEENAEVGYEQDTFVPGANLWFAPTSKINLTMSYTFNKQETENKMCVGWYHG